MTFQEIAYLTGSNINDVKRISKKILKRKGHATEREKAEIISALLLLNNITETEGDKRNE